MRDIATVGFLICITVESNCQARVRCCLLAALYCRRERTREDAREARGEEGKLSCERRGSEEANEVRKAVGNSA